MGHNEGRRSEKLVLLRGIMNFQLGKTYSPGDQGRSPRFSAHGWPSANRMAAARPKWFQGHPNFTCLSDSDFSLDMLV